MPSPLLAAGEHGACSLHPPKPRNHPRDLPAAVTSCSGMTEEVGTVWAADSLFCHDEECEDEHRSPHGPTDLADERAAGPGMWKPYSGRLGSRDPAGAAGHGGPEVSPRIRGPGAAWKRETGPGMWRLGVETWLERLSVGDGRPPGSRRYQMLGK